MRVPRATLILLALVGANPCHANGPQVGFQAGMIFPVRSEAVQLASEHVVIHLGEVLRDGRVSCSYTLRNLSDTVQTLQMAFSPYGFLTDSLDYEHLDFEVMARGKKLPVRFEKMEGESWSPYVDNPSGSLPVWDLSILAHDSLKVGMRYRAVWAGSSSWGFAYNARPASLWAGSIDYAKIEFEFEVFTAALLRCAWSGTNSVQVTARPTGGRWVGDTLVWEFRDWEPAGDVGIEVSIDRR